jgi:DNA-binding transcriptional MerR regulator
MINDVAEIIEVRIETIRIWCKIFNLQVSRDEKNQRIFSDENIQVLQKIKNWKQEKYSVEKIKDKLIAEYGSFDKPDLSTSSIDLHALKEIIKSEIEPVLELSEKYSRASFEIGSLKAQLEAEKQKSLLIQNSSAEYQSKLNEKEIALEKYRSESEKARFEVVRLDAELKDKDRQNRELIDKVAEMENKLKDVSVVPWYKRFFGKK